MPTQGYKNHKKSGEHNFSKETNKVPITCPKEVETCELTNNSD